MIETETRKLLFCAACMFAVATLNASGQAAGAGQQAQSTPAAPSLGFDVASVRPNKVETGSRQLVFLATGDRLAITNLPLSTIIQYAYKIQDSGLLSGLPNWAKSDSYDIEAKVADPDLAAFHKLSESQRRTMLQALLEDRFKLKVHREPRALPIFALVVAKNGPKMQETKPEDPHPNGPKRADGTAYQGATCFASSDAPGQLNCQATTMPTLANMVSAAGGTGRHVADRTGLMGAYDFTLHWTPESHDSTMPSTSGEGAQPPDSTGTSIFNALREQLGLKLEPSTGSFEGLVIDHVERPSGN